MQSSKAQSIETQFQTFDHNTTYRYFFVYFKFRQMKTIVPPISTQSLNLDIVVADKSLICGMSIHVALNFSHNDPRYPIRVLEFRQHHIVPQKHVDQKISFPGIEQSLQHHLYLSSRSAPAPGDCQKRSYRH